MSIKHIPAIVMLVAGAIISVISLIMRFEILYSLKLLLIVLILFYIIGIIAKKIIDKAITKQPEVDADDIELTNDENDELESENDETKK